ncbi:hypothetical protein D9M71_177680 [compost metagenome]
MLGIDLHQLQAQVTALGLLGDSHLQHIGGLIETAVGNTALGLGQNIDTGLSSNRCRLHGWLDEYGPGLRLRRRRTGSGSKIRRLRRRGGCRGGCDKRRCQLDVGRGHLQPFEAARRQVEIGTLVRLFRQGPGHAHVFLGFLLGLTAPRQKQQQQRRQQQPATADQADQDGIGQPFILTLVLGIGRLWFLGLQRSLFGDRGRDCRLGCGRSLFLFGHGFGWRRELRRNCRIHRGLRGLPGSVRRVLRFKLGQLIAFQLDQALHFVQLALQVGHPAFQLGIGTPGGIQVFFGHRQLVAQGLAVASGAFAGRFIRGRHQAELVLAFHLCRRGLAAGATGRINLLRARPQAPALAPGGVLLGHLGNRLRLRGTGNLLCIRHAQHLTGLQAVDVAIEKGIGVERLDGQHGLLYRTTLAYRAGDLPEGIALAGGVFGWRGNGWRGAIDRRGFSRRSKFRRVDQNAVVTQQTATGEFYLYQEFHERLGQRLARSNPQDTLAVRVDFGGKRQVIEKRLTLDARLGELFGRSQAGHQFGGRQVANVEQFDFGHQRLVQRRFQGQFPEFQRVRHTGRQRRRGGYC